MGCDIHGIIEQRKPGGNWTKCPAQIEHLWRDYDIFAHLGGARNYSDVQPVADKRGLPPDVCHDAHMKNCVYISESGNDGCVTKARAEFWISKGYSKWYRDGVFVTNPDWHSHSWCSTEELKEALARAGDSHDECYLHLVHIMEYAELLSHECRFVFWFDN